MIPQLPPSPPPSPKPTGPCDPEDRIGLILADGDYQIELTDILGVGAYGTVYRARDLQTNAQYAVKALNRLGLAPAQRSFQDREIRLHHEASQHENVVSMEMIFESDEATFVILEYCPEGDLFSKITEEGDYAGKDEKARHVFLQILDAVRHCHERGIYHRDLKPENILVRDDGWTVKLADFGLASQDRITSDFGCGSTFYMSPECQQTNPSPYACYESAPNDVWSLGVILVNLVCGRNPWKRASAEDSTFRAFMRDPNFLQTILPISSGLSWILQRIFDLNPKRRITLDALRDCIVRCRFFGLDGMLTPPYTPETSPDCYQQVLQPVPAMEPLPVPYQTSQVPTVFTPPSPPESLRNSPCQSQQYTDHVAHLPARPYAPFATQSGFIPAFQARCANFAPFNHQSIFRSFGPVF